MKRFIPVGLGILFLSQFASADNTPMKQVTLHTANGDIVVELDEAHAPITVKNFLSHVSAGDYDNGGFYRAVTPQTENNPNAPIQVIQGGAKDNVASTSQTIPLESTDQTGIHHVDGTISMARAADPNSATTEFFICIGDQPNLDFGGKRSADGKGFAAFGKVISGMPLVRAIQQMPVKVEGGLNQYLVEPVIILHANENLFNTTLSGVPLQ